MSESERRCWLKTKLWPNGSQDVKVWHIFALLTSGVLVAIGAALLVQVFGGSRTLQVVLAIVAFLMILLILIWDEPIGLAEGLGVIVALIALAGALIGGLIYLGPIEPEPAVGCISSEGNNQATISAKNTSIYPEADHTSTPTGLLLEGCIIRYDEYCIGSVQTDAQFSEVPDSRWLKLSDDEMVAAAHTVGVVPAGQSPAACAGGKEPPDRLIFRGATLARNGLLEVDATAPRAAVVGFALRRDDGRWRRLGWDQSPGNNKGKTLSAPAMAQPGDVVFATACMAFERPIGPQKRSRLRQGRVTGDALRFSQPTHRNAAAAACDAGIPEE